MNFESLFVLTYARSGSTLIQGLLNAIPGVLIRGENGGAFNALFRSWHSIAIHSELGSQKRRALPTNPWFGIRDANAEAYGAELVQTFVRNVLRPEPTTCVLGFKEIRYTAKEVPHLGEQVAFMRRFFPRAGFIVNTRNVEDAVRSIHAKGFKLTDDQVYNSDERLRALAAQSEGDIFHVHYDDYIADPGRLRGLFEFVGAPFDAAAVAHTLAMPHASPTRIDWRPGGA